MKKRISILLVSVLFLSAIILAGCGGGGGGGAGQPQIENGKNTITASEGGTVTYNSEVRLTIPENSLSQDAEIEILPVKELPSGTGDGLQPFGQAYKFTPAGTAFDLSNPAVMEIEYDETLLAKKGFSPETLALYYYDEELKEYIAVASYVDISKKKLIAYVEHFTLYLPMAKAKLAANNIPYIGNQNPVPNPIRAGAPIYIRSIVRDYDGSLAGVRIYYRKLQPSAGAWQSAVMTREVRPGSVDIYGYLIPASFLTASDIGTGNDFEYYVKATDNLGGVRTGTTRRFDVTRTYNAASLYLTPSTLNIAAGFETYFVTRGRDNTNTAFQIIPEIFSILRNKAALTDYKTNGILFHANSITATGSPEILTVEACGDSATANITIYSGELKGIEVLDTTGNSFNGTLLMGKNDVYEFDAVGKDEFGNNVLIIPTWSADAGIGTIDSNGKFTATGTGTGKVYITIGEYTDEQPVSIQTRVESTSPSNNEQNVENNAAIQVTFSDPIDRETVDEDAFKVVRIDGGIEYHVAGSFSFSGNTIVFNPSENLAYNGEYRVYINGNLVDALGFPVVPYTFTFKVKPKVVTGVILDKTEINMVVGSNDQLTATVEPADATDKSVTWVSDNTGVATVSDTGLVSAIGEGSAVITVKTNDGGRTAYCTANVNLRTYQVTYNGNDNTGGSCPYDSNAYVYNQQVIVKDSGTLAKKGYYFAGWNTQADGFGYNFNVNDSFYMKNSDVILYAKWISNPAILISELQVAGFSDADQEFIELYNPNTTNICLNGYKIYYMSPSGTIANLVFSFSATDIIPAHGHYLLVRSGKNVGVSADAFYTQPVGGSGGGLGLFDPFNNKVDSIGYGTATNAYREGVEATAPGAGESIERKPGGSLGNGYDTNNNQADFFKITSPNPQNTLSTPVPNL